MTNIDGCLQEHHGQSGAPERWQIPQALPAPCPQHSQDWPHSITKQGGLWHSLEATQHTDAITSLPQAREHNHGCPTTAGEMLHHAREYPHPHTLAPTTSSCRISTANCVENLFKPKKSSLLKLKSAELYGLMIILMWVFLLTLKAPITNSLTVPFAVLEAPVWNEEAQNGQIGVDASFSRHKMSSSKGILHQLSLQQIPKRAKGAMKETPL